MPGDRSMPMMPPVTDAAAEGAEDPRITEVIEDFLKKADQLSPIQYEPETIASLLSNKLVDWHGAEETQAEFERRGDLMRAALPRVFKALREKLLDRMQRGDSQAWKGVIRTVYTHDQDYRNQDKVELSWGERMSPEGRQFFQNIPLPVAVAIANEGSRSGQARDVRRMGPVIGAHPDSETFRVTSESIDYERLNDAAQSNLVLTEVILSKMGLRPEDLHQINLALDEWRKDPAHAGQLDDPSETIVLRLPRFGLQRAEPIEKWASSLDPAVILEQSGLSPEEKADKILYEMERGDPEQWVNRLRSGIFMEQTGSVGNWRGVVPQFSEVGKILLSRIPDSLIVAIPGKGRDRDGSTDRMLRIIGLTDGLRGVTERANGKLSVDFKTLNNAAELRPLLVETILGRVDLSSEEISDLNAGLKKWRDDERQRQKRWEEYHREPARTEWVSNGDITLTPIRRQEDLKK